MVFTPAFSTSSCTALSSRSVEAHNRSDSYSQISRTTSLKAFISPGSLSVRRLVTSYYSSRHPDSGPELFNVDNRAWFARPSIQPKAGRLLALLVLACSLARYSVGLNRRSDALVRSVSPPFCSLSTSATEQPAIQVQIKIEVKKNMAVNEIDNWLESLKEEAVQRGVSKDTVTGALDGVKPSKKIMEKDETQPEKKLTAEDYLKMMVSEYRVIKGVQAFLENKSLLKEVSADYGVPAPVLASIWGIESNYGSFQGSWNVIQALVTLAFNSPETRRKAFFREELFHALFILDKGEGPAGVSDMKGSWAGAMGQCQFMPSSYRTYAVDFDKDGRKDIWTSHADVFASMANYLVQHGWVTGGKYAQKVQVPADIDQSVCGLDVKKPVTQWTEEFKVLPFDGEEELRGDELVSLIAPDGPSGAAYLVWENFRVIMRYNISTLYSMAVYELAREIDARATKADLVQ